jgi:hypothetical protein
LLETDNLQNQRVIRSIPEFPERETEETMETGVASVAEKRLLFLGYCLEILEDDLFGKNEDKNAEIKPTGLGSMTSPWQSMKTDIAWRPT